LGIVLTRVHCAFSSSSSIAAVFHRPGYVIASLLVVVPCASTSARQNQWEPSFSSRISLWFPQTKFDSRRPTYWSRTLEKSMRMMIDVTSFPRLITQPWVMDSSLSRWSPAQYA
jgi:hypothetical protein